MALFHKPENNEVKFVLATVYSVESSGLRLLFDGQMVPAQKYYHALSSYSAPQVGDIVVVMKLSGTYVVMGSISGSAGVHDANTFYAGPASGNPAAAAFRKLVAADLPIVPISKGGTGQAGLSTIGEPSEIITLESNFTTDQCWYCQWGKVAMLFINVHPTEPVTSGGNILIGYLAEGKRPRLSAFALSYSHTRPGYINPNGDLHIYGNMSTAGGDYYIYSTYLLM